MTAGEFLKIVWRHKLIFVATILVALGLGYAFLEVQSPIYQAESTVALTPGETDELVFFSQINAIIPIYADAALTREAISIAEREIGAPLRDAKVQTTGGTSLFRIIVRDPDPAVAADGAQALTDALFERAERGQVGVPGLRLTQAERPAQPSEPVFPLPTLTLLIAGVVGAAAGAGLTLIRDSRTKKVEDASTLSRIAGVPSFGEVPKVSAVAHIASPKHLLQTDELRIVAESFRDLRTNLMFAKSNLKSIAITSPEGRHGKTTVSFGIATTMAQLGTRTILVDGDLRRGRVGAMLGIEHSPGLYEAMKGHGIDAVIRKTTMEGLDVITSGELSADPTELFEFAFPSILRELERRYEVIVIDSTPLVPINDARLLSSFVTATLLVVDPEQATARQVAVATERLSLIGVDLTAVVLNKSKFRPKSSYYAYLRKPEEENRRPKRRVFRSKAKSEP